MIDQIIKIEVALRPRYNPWGNYHLGYESGEALTMENGEIWFHPYSGAQPRLEYKEPN